MCNTQFVIHLHYNLDQTLKTPPAPNALSATPTAWKKIFNWRCTIMFPRKFPSFCTGCKPHPKSGLGLVSLLATLLPMTHNTGPKFISNWSTLTGEMFLCGSFHMVQTLHFHSPYPPPWPTPWTKDLSLISGPLKMENNVTVKIQLFLAVQEHRKIEISAGLQ